MMPSGVSYFLSPTGMFGFRFLIFSFVLVFAFSVWAVLLLLCFWSLTHFWFFQVVFCFVFFVNFSFLLPPLLPLLCLLLGLPLVPPLSVTLHQMLWLLCNYCITTLKLEPTYFWDQCCYQYFIVKNCNINTSADIYTHKRNCNYL